MAELEAELEQTVANAGLTGAAGGSDHSTAALEAKCNKLQMKVKVSGLCMASCATQHLS